MGVRAMLGSQLWAAMILLLLLLLQGAQSVYIKVRSPTHPAYPLGEGPGLGPAASID